MGNAMQHITASGGPPPRTGAITRCPASAGRKQRRRPVGDGGAYLGGGGGAAQSGCARAAVSEDIGDGPVRGRGRGVLTEVVEQHGGREDLRDRVGDTLPGDIRGASV